ncbi:MAG: sugar ABC transporter substrate-binding protein [Phototrophicales bacterium]|nr:MAG: sugar ABC transporter substrate-binding protein [Phototrophicales bacterium]
MSKKLARLVVIVSALMFIIGVMPTFAQNRITIIWYVGLGAGGQPQQIEAQNKVVDEFNASQDRIQLQIQIVDNNVAYDTLATLIATGQAPHIIGPVGADGSNAFAGNYLDLEPLIEASGYDISQFSPAAVEAFRFPGQGLVGLPFATFPSFIYFRKSLFDEADAPYPPQEYGVPYVDVNGEEKEWNMDTLRELAMYLTVDANGNDATMAEFDPASVQQWGFVSQWNEPRGISTMFGASSLVDENGGAVLPQAWVDAFNWYYNGIWVDKFIPNASQVGSDVLANGNAFSSGRVAMAHTHLWYTCCVGDTNDWDIAVMPSHNGVTTAKLHGDSFRLMRTSANMSMEEQLAAFEVLTYLIGEASDELLIVYGGMPAREEDTDAFFATLDERFTQGVNWQVAIDSLAYADSPNHEYNMPNYLKAKDRIGAFQSLIESTPDLDIQAELEKLVADLDVIFKE